MQNTCNEQHETFRAHIIVVPMPEGQDDAAAHLIVPQQAVADRLHLAFGHRDAMIDASANVDELAEATWEDAEWR